MPPTHYADIDQFYAHTAHCGVRIRSGMSTTDQPQYVTCPRCRATLPADAEQRRAEALARWGPTRDND